MTGASVIRHQGGEMRAIAVTIQIKPKHRDAFIDAMLDDARSSLGDELHLTNLRTIVSEVGYRQDRGIDLAL